MSSLDTLFLSTGGLLMLSGRFGASSESIGDHCCDILKISVISKHMRFVYTKHYLLTFIGSWGVLFRCYSFGNVFERYSFAIVNNLVDFRGPTEHQSEPKVIHNESQCNVLGPTNGCPRETQRPSFKLSSPKQPQRNKIWRQNSMKFSHIWC